MERRLTGDFQSLRSGEAITALAARICEEAGPSLRIMEVCGGHTHVIMHYGLHQLLPDGISFLHGPGCPVCIMPKGRIDHAIALARQEGVILVTLGDMMRVPGSESSLILERAGGRDVRTVYSPLEVLKIAGANPEKRIVYFAIGFETTAPLTAALVDRVLKEERENIFFHVNHVLISPALHAIMADDHVKVQAFIAPGHVSVITGAGIYRSIAAQYEVPIVVSGFEPVDLLESVLMIVRQAAEGRREVEIQYDRAVDFEGNPKAQELMERYFVPRKSFSWRGIGSIPESGLRLKEEYARFDAEIVYEDVLPVGEPCEHPACLCGEVLRGKAEPLHCTLFGKGCTPDHPAGACMVSSEGACNAYYRFRQV
ncbi:MAG: hydrogenase formation protein HypD [Deltaproteobacteria bacterium]|nr:hydrogenase formation protein HypD [Deltaproteobacteria bacterium]